MVLSGWGCGSYTGLGCVSCSYNPKKPNIGAAYLHKNEVTIFY